MVSVGDKVKFIGDIKNLVENVPDEEARQLEEGVRNGHFVVTDLKDGGIIEIFLAGDPCHYVYVTEDELSAYK